MSVDPLAELAPNMSPYRYAFNNPTNFIDPYGLFETRREAREYRRENEISGKIHKGEDGSFNIDDHENGIRYSRVSESERTNMTSPDGVDQSALVVGQKRALPSYISRAYNNAIASGEYGRYSPYKNDGFSVSYTGSAKGIFGEGNFTIGLAVANGDIALVVGAGGSIGVKPEMPGLKTGVQLGFLNNYGGNKDVLKGLAGTDIGYEGSLLLGGAYSTSARINNQGRLVSAVQGVQTISINAGLGFGAGGTVSTAEVYKLSNGIRRIGSWFSKNK